MTESLNDKEIKQKIKLRGKINLLIFENFSKEIGIEFNDQIKLITYKNEDEIIEKYEDNIDDSKYFNVIFLNYNNKEDGYNFLQKFIVHVQKNKIAKNNSDYPFFIFFENSLFNKEILYSYYLEKTKDMKISRFYDLKSHNLFFIAKNKDQIKDLITKDISNYYYEFDFKSDEKDNSDFKIEMLFMGQTGCGKSTFINYMLGKLRAFSASANALKSRGGTYTHTKYPITIKDSEGFEINDKEQEKKIFQIIEKNIEDELNTRTHIAFFLIPGPFNANRDLDYSCINSLIKLEQFNIHYYLIMTKEPEEDDTFSIVSQRFLNRIIKKNDFEKIKSTLSPEKLLPLLKKIKKKLETRIFTVDVSKRKSDSFGDLLNKINEDLKGEKTEIDNFLQFLINERNNGSNVQLDFSGSKIISGNQKFDFPSALVNSPFFSIQKFNNDENRRKKAERIIKEAKDVSSIRKLFLCYNSKIKENRKNMLKQILSIYECKKLTIDLVEGGLTDKEKNDWFYQHENTDELGKKIIDICESEFKKVSAIDKYIPYCYSVIKSINQFEQCIKEYLNFSLNGQPIPYDCELKVNQ